MDKYDENKCYEYENGFYLTTKVDRIGKLLTHYELYKKILDIPGEIIESGVFKGASLARFATYRNLLEQESSRKVIGFDIFDEFPQTSYEDDIKYREAFISRAGSLSASIDKLNNFFKIKQIGNIELVKGNIVETFPEYLKKNPMLKIALLHIDTDVYEPAKAVLDVVYDRMVEGSIIIFDDYGIFPGETKAADEFIMKYNLKINRLQISSNIPSFCVINKSSK